MGTTVDNLHFWINQMMVEKHINKYTVEISGSSSKGDGYLGEINFVRVVCELESGEGKIYDIVVKAAKIDDDDRTSLPVIETYQRETLMYTEVFPIIENFQNENSIENPFKNYAECYGVCSIDRKEALLLSNLKSLGYSIHDRMVPQNLDHIKLVFRNYALWHGSTIALRIRKPEVFERITKDMTDIVGDFIIQTNMLPAFKKFVKKSIDILIKRGGTDAAKKIQNIVENISTILTKMTIIDDKDATNEAVILHGDCWNNNMMFKYKGNGKLKPVDMKFLDFQCSRVASPILDLSYYLYSVADKVVLNKFDYILEEYHETLNGYLRQFGINCDDILTLNRLKNSWKKYGKFGLCMSSFLIRVELSHEDEVIDFGKETANQTMTDIDIDNIKYQEEYDRRVYDVFSHFAEKFL
ncbi:uncharacterized protein LOC130450782 [Diorhabda sublineata]|uniref:uncharacterized protein LOC130450782 n=1 Tax=Diorhabda sublineata TaxID=1163346 RepID=UPI0024E172E3|nr:uncharacterized protein LOC130450782 [Diorhabda sublineata]